MRKCNIEMTYNNDKYNITIIVPKSPSDKALKSYLRSLEEIIAKYK